MGKFSLRARRPRPSLSPSPFRPSYTSHKIGTAAVERPSIVGVTPQTAPTVQRALKNLFWRHSEELRFPQKQRAQRRQRQPKRIRPSVGCFGKSLCAPHVPHATAAIFVGVAVEK